MDTRRALLVDAFTAEPLAGNGAGVVPDADGLEASQMQAVARELGQSETAFVLPSESADRRLRFFSSAGEVPLCGHATVAAHGHLHAEGVVDAGVSTVATGVGTIEVEVAESGRVWMTQDAPTVEAVDVDRERVAAALGVDPGAVADLDTELPLARASTGNAYLVVPLNYLEQLGRVDPDLSAVEALTEDVDAGGLYAFTFDTLAADAALHGRMFAPAHGIPEDPVTGTASGAVAAYLRHFGAFDEMPERMVFEQGDFLDRAGRVHVEADGEIRVGGDAATALDGRLAVPEAAEDDIIEA